MHTVLLLGVDKPKVLAELYICVSVRDREGRGDRESGEGKREGQEEREIERESRE